MALTINGQLAAGADGLLTVMNNHSSEMSKSIQRVSTGLKINSSKDDAAGKAISDKMQSQIRSLDQSQENTQSANSLLKIADAAITSIVDVLTQMRTKALEGASDALSGEDREMLAMEIKQLKQQIDSSALVTQNGRYLLNGNFGTIEEAVTYDTDGEASKLHMSDFSWSGDNSMTFHIGPDRHDELKMHLMNMTSDHLFKDVTIDVSDVEASQKTAEDLNRSLTRALYQQTEIGSVQERLELTSDNLQSVTDNTNEALSVIQDADMAKEMTAYVKNNVLLQATQSMLAQANSNLSNFLDLMPSQ